ncbi:5-formyltetrahydrofolate cyclo-ligase [Neomegalonema perideroedes]|uniref:5-formyltetrahydrofolate cyclo-ligase n=1 Tax=Neomegalonema perideroedes TaxID=217219 RepID=UPI0003710329|nr:5-formyltetrahydrofolate cyclo-ligase [Neomegalonema perideroedes]
MSVAESEKLGRWAGRNVQKDGLRDEVWNALETTGVNVGPAWSRIPNFVGADVAAKRLSQTPFWASAKVVKCNPDPPQIPVRLRALYDGKLLYTPVPELVKGFPFVLLDPAKLEAKGVHFELAATSQGAVEHGEPVAFEDMLPMDVIVVGCVAVTREGGRTGKGGGFADLELGIFRELGKVPEGAPIVTTVHSSQVVDNPRIVMLPHDSALNWIFTELEAIETHSPYPQPKGVSWDAVQPDQLEDIPFLKRLKADLQDRKD